MARIARVVLPGYPHHVTQRGVRSMDIFSSDEDREEYLCLLSEQGRRFGVRFLAYCLMSNHVHLVAIPEEAGSLARGIGEANRLYTRAVNFRTGVRGYLFQGRFSSCAMDERHFVAAMRYVARNPVRVGLAKEAWDYRWSSAAYHVGLRKSDPLVKGHELLDMVSDWKALFRRDPEEMALLREKVRTGRPCGDAEFVARAERLTRRILHPLPAGRPLKRK